MSGREKLATGKQLKDQGNEHFKAGRIKEALGMYNQALLYLNGLDNSSMAGVVSSGLIEPLTADDKAEIDATILACWLNMAACYIRQERYTKAVDFCDKVLKKDENNVKAHFRKGQALLKSNNLDPAEQSLLKAAKLAPTDLGVRETLEQVRTRIRELEQKSRDELRARLKM
ncbi:hypothetical protein HK105_207094 [Polyrhizophydium stewartii]|uniref:Tetratricopeptide repeat protein n=1 Tax=Polyrhizophydium stewartii TaxID=2732419 RepID=A0ABR4N1G1_9FUNG